MNILTQDEGTGGGGVGRGTEELAEGHRGSFTHPLILLLLQWAISSVEKKKCLKGSNVIRVS